MSDEICVGDSFGTYEEQDKILVGLSGGVDSSVCVNILREQGFNVEALAINFSPAHTKAIDAAQVVADQLKIKLHIAQCHDLFEQNVIKPFCDSYCNGQTPNPCVICNPYVKFNILCETADKLGIKYIATGHYARVEEDDNGIFHVAKAESTARDQSYMLYRLPQSVLQRLCLPVGEFEKPDIRQIARDLNIASADAPDSQEICFIPDGDYPAYIASRGLKCKEGNFISPDNKVLGKHKGVLNYTVGQRRGLNIALGKPVFVKRILDNGDIQLGFSGEEFSSGFTICDIVTADEKPLEGTLFVKIRSAAQPTECIVKNINGKTTVIFPQPVRAAAPGQSAVFYDGDLVIGGGFIDDILD